MQKIRICPFLLITAFYFRSFVLKYFIKSIILLKNDFFTPLGKPTAEELLQKLTEQNIYKVRFSQFLKVVNKNKKTITYEKKGLQAGGLESQKFSGTIDSEREIVDFATSYLFKISPYLYLNEFGNVLIVELQP